MCGIVGIFNLDGSTVNKKDSIEFYIKIDFNIFNQINKKKRERER